jgi:hypothetical protein
MRKIIPAVTGLALLVLAGWTAPPGDLGVIQTNHRILQNIRERSEMMENARYLADEIGPRPTGSDNLKKANEWTRKKFQEYGLEAHLEGWEFGRAWTRGTARARVVEPAGLPLRIRSAGYAPGTDGGVTGRLAYVNARNVEELEPFRGKLAGTFVLVEEPNDVSEPPRWLAAPWEQYIEVVKTFKKYRWFSNQRTTFLRDEGVLGVFVDSDKGYGLFNMGGAGGQNPAAAVLPTFYTIHEDYLRLWRLAQGGNAVLEVEVSNAFSSGPVRAFNTVAELRGSDKPDEVVILGAHLDSWDLGDGSTDNGANCMAILEAARALKAVGAEPTRTIRFVLFGGEEQGYLGSRAYVRQHGEDLENISAVLILDLGHGRIKGISLHGRDQVRPIIASALAPLNSLGLQELTLNYQWGTDHLPFLGAGVPAFAFYQELDEYLKTHHSEVDTFDKISAEYAEQSASILAVAAYNIAQLPDKLPRQTPEPEAQESDWF